MEFLEVNQVCEWAEDRGIERGDGFELRLEELPSTLRATYAEGHQSGRETLESQRLLKHLTGWDECLVWIKQTGVWPSSEDWPKVYAWRGSFGEKRSIDTAPGHAFKSNEEVELAQLVTIIMENAWDALLICSFAGRANHVRAWISHDEWYEVFGSAGTNKTSAG